MFTSTNNINYHLHYITTTISTTSLYITTSRTACILACLVLAVEVATVGGSIQSMKAQPHKSTFIHVPDKHSDGREEEAQHKQQDINCCTTHGLLLSTGGDWLRWGGQVGEVLDRCVRESVYYSKRIMCGKV